MIEPLTADDADVWVRMPGERAVVGYLHCRKFGWYAFLVGGHQVKGPLFSTAFATMDRAGAALRARVARLRQVGLQPRYFLQGETPCLHASA
jgi:hypothetical protein